MSDLVKPTYRWFKGFLILGLLLGFVLLGQTIATYHYVSATLVRQEALREAERKRVALERSARMAGVRDAAHLAPMLEELHRELPRNIAWVRILSVNGTALAGAGEDEIPYSPEQLRRMVAGREHASEVRETPSGKVMVVVSPFRLAPPLLARTASPQRIQGVPEGPTPPMGLELAIQLDRVSVSFGRLRQNVVIGSSAAIALLASIVMIGLRFPHYIRGKQFEQELEVARRVQQDLLPRGRPLTDDLEFAAECIPAWQVGGDLYDAFAEGHGRIAFALGDVSGKGLAAALLMGVIHGAIRSSNWTVSPDDHERCTRHLNELLCARTARERFASLFWCCYEPHTEILHYVNAGHPPPLLIHEDIYGNTEVERLTDGGPVLGVLPAATYQHGSVSIRPGDLLVMFSDGIVETADSEGEEFGEERLISAIRERLGESPAELRDGILGEVRSFLGRRGQPEDDQTLLVVWRQPLRASDAGHEGPNDQSDRALLSPV